MIPPTGFSDSTLSDLVVIAPGDVLPMFRRWSESAAVGVVRRAPGSRDWQHIPAAEPGLSVTRDDLMLLADTMARFEEEYGMFRRVGSSPGRGHDWESFYAEMILRLFQGGLPEKQADLVGDMQDWFVANSLDGDVPDESTIRKRISPIWRKLRADA